MIAFNLSEIQEPQLEALAESLDLLCGNLNQQS